ncbi:DUF3800 domain-containing protein [Parasphingorhabdus cellanae]|uniref:DUF3800 domain-containing protein n=1 Tax=Parasphingorhabdus cellanae TaxID=2806553 RepID=A0ABX7SZK4_9SPHN|nr:DUF3800 domain-containing protein [Parasphingorhabdus cellanae]QTD54713.1 DUF3800 domain-containing protein [Parasphingorhabdus cellanae]
MAKSKNPKDECSRSKFIVYVDESGDHSLDKVDEKYPVFVLAFCVFYQDNYVRNVVSAIEKLKFDEFGHDIVILHERDIRKEQGVFRFRDREAKIQFMESLTEVIEESNFILISCLIDKRKIRVDDKEESNPYHVALGFCLETLADLLAEKGQEDHETHIVFERRGTKEDRELELEFRRICAGSNSSGNKLPFEIILADKKVNSAGLQLADLVARPIGIHYMRPDQPNRAFEVLKTKFYCEGGRDNLGSGYEGWGLKIHPN